MNKFEEMCEIIIEAEELTEAFSKKELVKIMANRKRQEAKYHAKYEVENLELKGPEGTHSLGKGKYGKEKGKPLFRKVYSKFIPIEPPKVTHKSALRAAGFVQQGNEEDQGAVKRSWFKHKEKSGDEMVKHAKKTLADAGFKGHGLSINDGLLTLTKYKKGPWEKAARGGFESEDLRDY